MYINNNQLESINPFNREKKRERTYPGMIIRNVPILCEENFKTLLK